MCGGFSPSQQLLQVWGTHIDKAGRHTLGRDIYKIHLSSQSLSAEGKSASISPLSPDDAWLAEVKLESSSLLSSIGNKARTVLGLPMIAQQCWEVHQHLLTCAVFIHTNLIPFRLAHFR